MSPKLGLKAYLCGLSEEIIPTKIQNEFRAQQCAGDSQFGELSPDEWRAIRHITLRAFKLGTDGDGFHTTSPISLLKNHLPTQSNNFESITLDTAHRQGFPNELQLLSILAKASTCWRKVIRAKMHPVQKWWSEERLKEKLEGAVKKCNQVFGLDGRRESGVGVDGDKEMWIWEAERTASSPFLKVDPAWSP